jgi:soluble lytic murein transglycosylase-like protein
VKLKYFLLSILCAFAVTMASGSLALAPQEPEVEDALRQLLKQSIEQADSFEDRFDAEVWLVAKSAPLARYIKDPEERFRILRLVHREASRVGVQADLVLAVIQIESAFDPYAVSHVGAQGMMQVMPFWKKEIGREQDSLIDLETNLRYGCTILKYYIDKEKGRWSEGLARYNGSYGKYWYPEKVLTAWQKHWRH